MFHEQKLCTEAWGRGQDVAAKAAEEMIVFFF
jgi:hypothetical protein